MAISLKNFILQQPKIGCGAFGTVWKVQEIKTGNVYASKIINISLDCISAEEVHNFTREVNILSKLNHPAIIKFKGFSLSDFDDKPYPVIITEFIANGSLLSILNSVRKSITIPKWDDTRKLIIIYGISCAMSYLHSHKIIHRDLKPANILLNDFFFPKVADFGVSKRIHTDESSTGMTNGPRGTPLYMAPEILEEDIEYSTAVDVYSFGIILYEIITGLEPFKNMKYAKLLLAVTSNVRPPLNDDIPSSYKELIKRCWSQNPEERPTFDQIVIELKNNKGFITEKVVESEFRAYVNSIENTSKEFDSKKLVVKIEDIIKPEIKTITFPEDILKLLSPECRETVQRANEDREIQFYVGQCLIEGADDFPKNEKLGIKYVVKAIDNGSIESAIFYSRLLIEGKIIPRDLKKAQTTLEPFRKFQHAIVSLLYGKIMKKQQSFASAKEHFEISKNAGNAEAMYEYGKLLYEGVGIKKNIKEAKKYFLMAKRNGFNKSDQYLKKQEKLKESLENVPTDKKERFEHYKALADKKVPEAMYQCGLMLFEGDGVKMDKKKAFSYFELAAGKGHQDAMIKCGHMLKEGDGISQKKENAVSYFMKAAKDGNIEGMAQYGKMLFYGDGIPVDRHKALRYIKRAVDNENIEAMYIYAIMLHNGDGVFVDDIEAAKYFKIAGENGNPDAMYNYAKIALNGDEKIFEKSEAAKFFKMAIAKGNPKAMYEYACMLLNGNGIPTDKPKAVKYLKMAIKNGNANAMREYAILLLDGEVVRADKEEAFKYFKMASEKGDETAICEFANLLLKGDKVPADRNEAIKHFKMAIEKGNATAMCNYATMLLRGDCVQIDKKEAIRYYKMAIEKGNSTAMHNYATILLRGDGVESDKKLAIDYIKKSIELGNSDAMYKYGKLLQEGNEVEANKYFKMALDKGNVTAMLNEATNLLYGINIKADQNKALEYIMKAIQDKNSSAMLIYSNLLRYGNKCVKKDLNKSLKYLKMACEEGNDNAIHKYLSITLNDEEEEKKKLPIIRKAIERGSSYAMYHYSLMLLNGDLVPFDKNEVIKYLKIAIEKGNPEAMHQYGKMFLTGDVVPIDKIKAANYFKMAADKGNLDSACQYAVMLCDGDGIPVDIEKSKKYFSLSIDRDSWTMYQNSIRASKLITGNHSGNYYTTGCYFFQLFLYAFHAGNPDAIFMYIKLLQLIKKNPERKSEIVRYLKMLIKKGHPDAMFEYAKMLFNGDDVPVDKKEALHYFKILADRENTNAMYYYAMMLLNGDGIPVNKKEAIKYFKILIEKGNPGAMFQMAKILLNENDGVPADKTKAINYLKQATALEDPEATYYYGMKLLKGDGVPINKTKALEYIKKAAYQKNIDARSQYIKMIMGGEGYKADYDQVFEFLVFDYNNGNSEALHEIYSLYQKNLCRRTDIRYFYENAIRRGDSEAMAQYASIIIERNIIPVNIENSYIKIEKKDEEEDSYNYERQKEDARDEATQYLLTAIGNGNTNAMVSFGRFLLSDNFKLKFKYNDVLDAFVQFTKYYIMTYDHNSFYNSYIMKSEAAFYFKMAADKGNSDGMFEYANMLYHGIAIPVDKKEALRYYKMAVDKKNPDAIIKCYKIFNTKIDDYQNFVKSAADKGYPYAMYEYGKMLLNGNGVPCDKKEAMRYLESSAIKNIPEAMFLYATLIFDSDHKNAFYYLSASAFSGNCDATFKLAKQYIDSSSNQRIQIVNYLVSMIQLGNSDSTLEYVEKIVNLKGYKKELWPYLIKEGYIFGNDQDDDSYKYDFD